MKELIDELADVDWRDPAWWALLGAARLAEGFAALRGVPATYLSSDAEPSSDTFMGWPAARPARLCDAIATAIVSARAAARAITELDGTLPDQPLRVSILAGHTSSLIPASPQAVFIIGTSRLVHDLATPPLTLSEALARSSQGAAWESTGAPLMAVVVGDHAPSVARHLHRRAWTRAGGPWLGLGHAGDLAIASTCHLVVDGYGHAELARRIAEPDATLHAQLSAAARAICGDAPVPPLPPLAAAPSLSVAYRRVPQLPRFATMAYELGRLLHTPPARFSPTIQVPVAPGAPDDPQRFRRRVVTALLSVRFPDSQPEPLDAFTARAHAAIAREARHAGLLSRLLAATAALPIPLALKRHALVGARAPRLHGPVEVLAGRSSLSVLRGSPLVAISSPGLVVPPDDPRTTSVITAVGDMVSVASTGAGTAEELLDRYVARLGPAASGSGAAAASR